MLSRVPTAGKIRGYSDKSLSTNQEAWNASTLHVTFCHQVRNLRHHIALDLIGTLTYISISHYLAVNIDVVAQVASVGVLFDTLALEASLHGEELAAYVFGIIS